MIACTGCDHFERSYQKGQSCCLPPQWGHCYHGLFWQHYSGLERSHISDHSNVTSSRWPCYWSQVKYFNSWIKNVFERKIVIYLLFFTVYMQLGTIFCPLPRINIGLLRISVVVNLFLRSPMVKTVRLWLVPKSILMVWFLALELRIQWSRFGIWKR